jgi:hypothetical protein
VREDLIRQLLDRRRAVRAVRLVNRLRHPYHRVDGDFYTEVRAYTLHPTLYTLTPNS